MQSADSRWTAFAAAATADLHSWTTHCVPALYVTAWLLSDLCLFDCCAGMLSTALQCQASLLGELLRCIAAQCTACIVTDSSWHCDLTVHCTEGMHVAAQHVWPNAALLRRAASTIQHAWLALGASGCKPSSSWPLCAIPAEHGTLPDSLLSAGICKYLCFGASTLTCCAIC